MVRSRTTATREVAILAYNLARLQSSYKACVVADCMRHTRFAYTTMQIRRLKKDEESIIRERVADAMLNDEGRNFWSEVKRLLSQKTTSSRIIDGQTDAGSIASL